MEKISWFKSFFESIKPLPRLEDEENRFFLAGFDRLSHKEIRGTIKITLDEVKKSRKYGLMIDADLIQKEEYFFLKMINDLGGTANMFQDRSYEEVQRLFTEKSNLFFEVEKRKYVEHFSKVNDGKPKNRYQCHLEVLQNNILITADNGRLSVI